MSDRLSSLDGSFLRVETPSAHMHVAWSATFRRAPDAPPPTLSALRSSVLGRLEQTPRFRRRLAFPPPGMGEPFWVDDEAFDIARHVVVLGEHGETVDDERFHELCDCSLSEPLDRSLPLWRIYLAPRMSDGRCGMVAKIHHALVDGKSAVEVALLLFDVAPEPPPGPEPEWHPESSPGTARLPSAGRALP